VYVTADACVTITQILLVHAVQKKGKAKEAKKSKGAACEESSEPAEDQETVGHNAAVSVELHKAPAGHAHPPLSR